MIFMIGNPTNGGSNHSGVQCIMYICIFTLLCIMVHYLCIYYVFRYIKAATNPLNVHHPSQIKKCSREGSTSKAWNKAQCFDPLWVPSYDMMNWENPNPKVSSPKLLSCLFEGKKAPSFKVIVPSCLSITAVFIRDLKKIQRLILVARSSMSCRVLPVDHFEHCQLVWGLSSVISTGMHIQ